MKNYKLHTTEGFRDIYGTEMLVKKEIERRTVDVYKSYGYELIKTPTVEYIDVYSLNAMQKPDLYNLINRQGEVLALCNDMTSSIARFVCANFDSGVFKYCYAADTFRYPKMYQGKEHQFLQAGIELIGAEGIQADVECIYTAYKSLKACNVNEFTIHIGSAEFLDLLIADFNLNSEVKKAIYDSIENKDYVTLKQVLNENLDKDKADFVVDLMLRGGKLHYLEDLMEKLVKTKAYNVLAYLKDVYNALKELGIENIIFDFSIYSYAGYYTGIIFSIYVEGVSKALVDGGRCDTLFTNYGKDFKDVGFGLDIDALTGYVLENDLIEIKNEKYLAYVTDDSLVYAVKMNDKFRADGIEVNQMPFDTLESATSYAKRHCIEKIIVYKNNAYEIVEVK